MYQGILIHDKVRTERFSHLSLILVVFLFSLDALLERVNILFYLFEAFLLDMHGG